MKIYTVLYKNDIEGSWVCGVFESREKANLYIEKSNDSEFLFEIEEWNIKSKENEEEVKICTSFNMSEYEYEEYMLCNSCDSDDDVGNFFDGKLYFKYCPNCGQKLKFTESLYE